MSALQNQQDLMGLYVLCNLLFSIPLLYTCELQRKGEFILMSNGIFYLCDPLPEYKEGDVTTECKLV
jgi:hypothetical protein